MILRKWSALGIIVATVFIVVLLCIYWVNSAVTPQLGNPTLSTRLLIVGGQSGQFVNVTIDLAGVVPFPQIINVSGYLMSVTKCSGDIYMFINPEFGTAGADTARGIYRVDVNNGTAMLVTELTRHLCPRPYLTCAEGNLFVVSTSGLLQIDPDSKSVKVVANAGLGIPEAGVGALKDAVYFATTDGNINVFNVATASVNPIVVGLSTPIRGVSVANGILIYKSAGKWQARSVGDNDANAEELERVINRLRPKAATFLTVGDRTWILLQEEVPRSSVFVHDVQSGTSFRIPRVTCFDAVVLD